MSLTLFENRDNPLDEGSYPALAASLSDGVQFRAPGNISGNPRLNIILHRLNRNPFLGVRLGEKDFIQTSQEYQNQLFPVHEGSPRNFLNGFIHRVSQDILRVIQSNAKTIYIHTDGFFFRKYSSGNVARIEKDIFRALEWVFDGDAHIQKVEISTYGNLGKNILFVTAQTF